MLESLEEYLEEYALETASGVAEVSSAVGAASGMTLSEADRLAEGLKEGATNALDELGPVGEMLKKRLPALAAHAGVLGAAAVGLGFGWNLAAPALGRRKERKEVRRELRKLSAECRGRATALGESGGVGRSGEAILEGCHLHGSGWGVLGKVEQALGEADDHRIVGSELLCGVEGLVRDLLGSGRDVISVAVLEHCKPRQAKILSEVLERGHHFTFGTLSIWTEGLERGWSANSEAIRDYLREFLEEPGRVLSTGAVSHFLNATREKRNAIVHRRVTRLTSGDYGQLCERTVGTVRVHGWLHDGPPRATALVTLLVERQRLLLEAEARGWDRLREATA